MLEQHQHTTGAMQLPTWAYTQETEEARRLALTLERTVIMPALSAGPTLPPMLTERDGRVSLSVNNPFEALTTLIEAAVERFYEVQRKEPEAIILKSERLSEVKPFRYYYSRRGHRITYYQCDTHQFDVCVKGVPRG